MVSLSASYRSTIRPADDIGSAPARGAGFLVGRDGSGRWIAVAGDGRQGGVFVSREAALRFAAAQRRGEVREAPGEIALSL